MTAICKDIATLINGDSSNNLILSEDLFYGRMPTKPQTCAVIYDNAGPPPLLQYIKARSTYEYGAFSVRVRASSYDKAYEIIESIREFLHGLNNVVANDHLYMLVEAVNAVGIIHYDENDRPVLFQNYTVQRKKPS